MARTFGVLEDFSKANTKPNFMPKVYHKNALSFLKSYFKPNLFKRVLNHASPLHARLIVYNIA